LYGNGLANNILVVADGTYIINGFKSVTLPASIGGNTMTKHEKKLVKDQKSIKNAGNPFHMT